MRRTIFISLSTLVLMVVFTLSTFAKTQQDFGKWKKGENLVENGDFEQDTAAWTLEDGACCGRGGQYQWEIDKKNVKRGNKALKVIGVKATGTDWHAKVRHETTSMRAGKDYTVVFWARSEKPREVSLSLQMQHDPWTFYQGGKFLLEGPEWKEYSLTFRATADVDRDMWVGLAIAQSDVTFWIDDFRFFEGELKDEIGREEKFAVDAQGKLSTTWGRLKSQF